MRTQLLTYRVGTVDRRLEQSVGPGLKYSSRCDVTWRSCDSGCQVQESPEARVCTAAQGCTSTLSTFRQSPWESSKVSDRVASPLRLHKNCWCWPTGPAQSDLQRHDCVTGTVRNGHIALKWSSAGCTSAKFMVHRCSFKQNPGRVASSHTLTQ